MLLKLQQHIENLQIKTSLLDTQK